MTQLRYEGKRNYDRTCTTFGNGKRWLLFSLLWLLSFFLWQHVVLAEFSLAPRAGGWIDGMADISKLSKGRKGGVILDKEWLDQVRAHLKSLDPDLKLKIDEKILDDLGFLGGFRAGDGTVIL